MDNDRARESFRVREATEGERERERVRERERERLIRERDSCSYRRSAQRYEAGVDSHKYIESSPSLLHHSYMYISS